MVFGEVDVIDVEIISGKIVGKSVKVVVFGKFDVVEVVVVLVFGKVYDVVEVVSDVIEIVGKVGKIVVNKLLFVEIVGKSLLWLVEVVNKLLFFGKLFDVVEVVVLISGKVVNKISFVEVVVWTSNLDRFPSAAMYHEIWTYDPQKSREAQKGEVTRKICQKLLLYVTQPKM